MKLLKMGALVCAVGVVFGAGFVASSHAQGEVPDKAKALSDFEDKYTRAKLDLTLDDTPKAANAVVGFYRQAADDPEKLQIVERLLLRNRDESSTKHFQLLQIEQNARLIELMKTRAPK